MLFKMPLYFLLLQKMSGEDWQRHKRFECVAPPRTKNIVLETMAPDVYAETVQNAESMKGLIRSKQAGEADDWKNNLSSKGLPVKKHDRPDEMRRSSSNIIPNWLVLRRSTLPNTRT